MITTSKGYQYPEETDAVTNYPTAAAATALLLEARPGVSVVTTAQRNAYAGTDLWTGRVVWNTDTNQLEEYNGAAWLGASSFSFSPWGDGSDGAVTISANTTLTRSMYYSSLTINVTVTLHVWGCSIACSGTLTNNGTIDASGAAATSSSGAIWSSLGGGATNGSFPGVSGGSGSTTNGAGTGTPTIMMGGGGGSGGNGSGTGGSSNFPTIGDSILRTRHMSVYALMGLGYNNGAVSFMWGGCGGGGGGGDNGSGVGGGGGTGAGMILIQSKFVAGNGSVVAIGGAGFHGTAINTGGGGGGGGGGIWIYSTTPVNPWTLTVTGGAGGASGGGTGTAGANGSAGNTDYITA